MMEKYTVNLLKSLSQSTQHHKEISTLTNHLLQKTQEVTDLHQQLSILENRIKILQESTLPELQEM